MLPRPFDALVLCVPPRLDRLEPLRATVMSLGQRYADCGVALPARRLYGWGLAVFEAASNAIRQGATSESLVLAIEPGPDQLMFRLIDHGAPHAPWPEEQVPPPLGEPDEGLFLVRQLVDHVSYRRTAGRNEVCLVAKLTLDMRSRTP